MPPKKLPGTPSVDTLHEKEDRAPISVSSPQRDKKGPKDKSKGNKQDDDFRVLERRKRVAQMYCEGKTQFEISKATGVTQAMISVDLKTIREAWLATAIMDWDDVKAKELAKLDLVEERMWEAYHRTVGQEVITTKDVKRELREAIKEQPGRSAKRRGKGLPPPDDPSWNSDIDGPGRDTDLEMTTVEERENTRTKDIPGNPAYMTIILECIKTRCKILGFLDDKNGANNNQQIGAIDWDVIALVKTAPDPIEARISKLLVIEGTETSQPVGSISQNPSALVPIKEE